MKENKKYHTCISSVVPCCTHWKEISTLIRSHRARPRESEHLRYYTEKSKENQQNKRIPQLCQVAHFATAFSVKIRAKWGNMHDNVTATTNKHDDARYIGDQGLHISKTRGSIVTVDTGNLLQCINLLEITVQTRGTRRAGSQQKYLAGAGSGGE